MSETKVKKGGKRPNAGRKSKAEENGLKRLLERCWTGPQRANTIRQLAQKAMSGDMEAIKLLMAYAYGKPTEHKEISGPNNGPVRFTLMIDNADSGAGRE